MSKLTILVVGIGGMLGSIFRYMAGNFIAKLLPIAFPMGTLTVNVVGCLLIGLFFGISERYSWLSPEMRIFLTTGFCGGFTTFSSFAYENIGLLQSGNYGMFILYTFLSLLLGLLFVFAGITLTRL